MANPWLQWWSDKVPLLMQPTYPRLLLAMVLGAMIGAERQWRQRSAGMRTATLVCFGAAAFVDLGATLAGPNSTGVIAYVVSGVGFLGAGAIMKEGANVRGLNTAATLWCSAAVGACAGAGELLDATFAAFCLMSINVVLRPISRYLDRRSLAQVDAPVVYRLEAVCEAPDEASIRHMLTRAVAERPLILRQLRTEDIGNGENVSIRVELESPSRDTELVDQIAVELRSNPKVTAVELAEGAIAE